MVYSSRLNNSPVSWIRRHMHTENGGFGRGIGPSSLPFAMCKISCGHHLRPD